MILKNDIIAQMLDAVGYPNGEIPVGVLFTDAFMEKHTQSGSFQAWLSAGGFGFKSQPDFDGFNTAMINAHVSQTSDFHSWEEMQESAVAAFFDAKLNH